MNRAYLALGSNLGDRFTLLVQAVRELESESVRVTQLSSIYETEPQGKVDQPHFLNAVAEIQTALEPAALLAYTQSVEAHLGRVRIERWGPRTVDIDLILFEGVTSSDPVLTLPHPRAAERAFVLIPLLEINPTLPYRSALAALADQGVRRFMAADPFARAVRGVQ